MKRRVQPLMARDTLCYTDDEDTWRMTGFEVEDDVIIERLGKIFKDMPPYTPRLVPEYSIARLLVPHPGGSKIAPLVDHLKEAPGRLATYVKHLVSGTALGVPFNNREIPT
jgi:hypothetical protein